MTCVCAWCGVGPVKGRLYCGNQCQNAVRHHWQRASVEWGTFPGVHRSRPMRKCAWCGESFKARDHVRTGPQRYCGFECRNHATVSPRWSTQEEKEAALKVDALRSLARVLACRLRALERPAFVLGGWRWRPLVCEDCGTAVLQTTSHQRRCDSCALENARETRRSAKHRRRSATRGGDLIKTRVLAERDGWCCGLCGYRVPRNVNYLHPKAPTCDHIVPLSAGGEHVWMNVQLAHRECNSRRGAGGVAQLRWVD